jgi:hypothetical protein
MRALKRPELFHDSTCRIPTSFPGVQDTTTDYRKARGLWVSTYSRAGYLPPFCRQSLTWVPKGNKTLGAPYKARTSASLFLSNSSPERR